MRKEILAGISSIEDDYFDSAGRFMALWVCRAGCSLENAEKKIVSG